MLLYLEARAKHCSLLSKTFPLLVLQRQDVNNKLANLHFRRFCRHRREQKRYRKIAEKINWWFSCVEDVYGQQRHVLSHELKQGQIPGPAEAQERLDGSHPKYYQNYSIRASGQRHQWGLPCLMLPSDNCQWISGWENPCWWERGARCSDNTTQPPPVGKGGLFTRAGQSRNETWMLWFALQSRLSRPEMVMALWAAEIGYLMWGVGRCLPGQGERHGQSAG